MNIALIAHDSKKELMVQFCIAYCRVLSQHDLCATRYDGQACGGGHGPAHPAFSVRHPWGRPADRCAHRLQRDRPAALLQRPDQREAHEPNEMNLLRLCDVHNIPIATNIATAEVLIHGLERGDLDWRNIVNPNR